MARPDGFEPPTTWFEAKCSIQLSYGRMGDGFCTIRPPRSERARTDCWPRYRGQSLASLGTKREDAFVQLGVTECEVPNAVPELSNRRPLGSKPSALSS